jgi:hypothetical protein
MDVHHIMIAVVVLSQRRQCHHRMQSRRTWNAVDSITKRWMNIIYTLIYMDPIPPCHSIP